MEQAQQIGLDAIIAKDTWTAEDYAALLEQLFATNDAARKFRTILADMAAANPEPKGSAALKIGIARFMLGESAEAAAILANATDNKDRHYFMGLCYQNMRQYGKAAEEFGRALDRGWDHLEIDVLLVECAAMGGDIEGASKMLGKIASKLSGSADFFYLQGLIQDLSGNGETAAESYEQARQINPSHPEATFRLAYYYDLHGEEESAIELYKECVSKPPVHANALLNLSVLYEDSGKYEMAFNCLQRILTTNPNHFRARLFMRDVMASKTMYYDEDKVKRIARRNAVLDIPVTDFELSVRARNCLKKMNLRTLGDLVRTSEAELLGYKNFGETSLKEIKEMLSAKGLRLGQALEDGSDLAPTPVEQPAVVGNEGVLATPMDQVEFSVRSRRALQNLNIRTLGDLAAKTEAELLACKNFGQTSLNEIRQRLGDYGLQLRESH